jgi:TubC N-terminal docking domain
MVPNITCAFLDDILEGCSRDDIRLWVDDGRLKYDAPWGGMTDEMKRSLRERKNELIEFFTTGRFAVDPTLADPPAPPFYVSRDGVVSKDRPEQFPKPTDVPSQVPPWPPRPAELAHWPIPWRQRWGELANKLQDRGVPWPEHERQAFDLVKADKEAVSSKARDLPPPSQ